MGLAHPNFSPTKVGRATLASPGSMTLVEITRGEFLSHPHGKTFSDVLNDPDAPFDEVLEFFNEAARQQRMEDSEIHHDRAPLAGVVRELESLPSVGGFLATLHRQRSARLRQAIGVLVRMIMERRGWRTTGKKGSLGVRGSRDSRTPYHNTGGPGTLVRPGRALSTRERYAVSFRSGARRGARCR